jgi:hypothetical protein
MRLRKRGWLHMHRSEIIAAVSDDNIYLACIHNATFGLQAKVPILIPQQYPSITTTCPDELARHLPQTRGIQHIGSGAVAG